MNKALTLIVATALTLFEGVQTLKDENVTCHEQSDCKLSHTCSANKCMETCPDTGCREQGGACVDIRRASLTDNTVFPLNAVDLGNKIGDSSLCEGITPKVCCECYKRAKRTPSCIDRGCGKLWDGAGKCVNMTAVNYLDLKANYDLAKDTEEIKNNFTLCQSSVGDKECCRCLKSTMWTYRPQGPQTMISETIVEEGGWSLCHSEPYNVEMTDSSISTIQGKCTGDKIMVACRRVGASKLTALAWADRATVFGVTDKPMCGFNGYCSGNVAQGTKWYRTTIGKEEGAWGFAGSSSPIKLTPADWPDSDGEKRLSWYVNYSGNAGYRCGTTKSLSDSQDWEKVFYHAKLANQKSRN